MYKVLSITNNETFELKANLTRDEALDLYNYLFNKMSFDMIVRTKILVVKGA